MIPSRLQPAFRTTAWMARTVPEAPRASSPSEIPIARLDRFELLVRRQFGSLPAMGGNFAVAEIGAAHGDTAQIEAFHEDGIEGFPGDQFGAAAADVHHQLASGRTGQAVDDALVDEPRLLDTGDGLDGVAQGGFSADQKILSVVSTPEGVGPHGADSFGSHVHHPLAEAPQAVESTKLGVRGEPPGRVESSRQLDHLPQPIQDHYVSRPGARHDHVEAVGAQVHGGHGMSVEGFDVSLHRSAVRRDAGTGECRDDFYHGLPGSRWGRPAAKAGTASAEHLHT